MHCLNKYFHLKLPTVYTPFKSGQEFLAIMVLFLFCSFPLIAQDMQVQFSQHKYLPGYTGKKLRHPEMFQGNKKRKNYFEGWYFKMVSADHRSILSVIPGISLSSDGKEQHAFIQVIDGISGQTRYQTFPIESFSFSKDKFAILISENYFSQDSLILNLQSDSFSLIGKVVMLERKELPPKKVLNPGIMGWYRFVPSMQCYHGVLALSAKLRGVLLENGKAHDFTKGMGYAEKDWGSSMPSAWIWIQSNNFTKSHNSFMLSVARVPFLGNAFTGFLGFFLKDSVVYRFATYTHAKLQILRSSGDTVELNILSHNKNYHLVAWRNKSGLLKAPQKGSMDRRIPESIDAIMELSVYDKKGTLIFKDRTDVTGLELVGDRNTLQTMHKKK